MCSTSLWRLRNTALKRVKGLQNKLWLSGVATNTLGGFDVFDTMQDALDCAINHFPKVAAGMNAALYTRVIDASTTEEASRAMGSPFYD